jgi:polyferredoxin/formate hydrogenlyase subunit 6/NADH:ubiquinone oxidoreductase subunit I
MRIVLIRRISQVFFLCLFLWFCVAASLGDGWWQLRGWPINWFLELDPLTGLVTLLATGTVFAGLLWGLASIVLTLILGRFFCGWLCPFGTMHHFVGWLGSRSKSLKERMARNAPRRASMIKYFLLAFFLAAAMSDLVLRLGHGQWAAALAGALVLGLILSATRRGRGGRFFQAATGVLLAAWVSYSLLLPAGGVMAASLLSGLLDPIPLLTRSMNLVVLPLADAPLGLAWPLPRLYQGAALIGSIFIAALLLNLWLPRFYCRFVCPLGALFGLLSRFSLWRLGKTQADCSACGVCDAYCEGACKPQGVIHQQECVLCMNCLDLCPDHVISYQTAPSAAGEQPLDLSRRRVLAALGVGLAAPPMLRLGGLLGPDWDPRLVRPPGALSEDQFLRRCLRCGQCMRVCPTGVLQPAGLSFGLEAMWTPVLNMTIGSSGCQPHCTACGHVCPSAAIRQISVQEKLGQGSFQTQGPIRLGCAFIDRGRCLPWAMDRPCIVCQENCPTSPKAIFTRERFNPVISGLKITKSVGGEIAVSGARLKPGALGTGDYYASSGDWLARITGNSAEALQLAPPQSWGPPSRGSMVRVLVRLQQPYVDPARCTGCGICEHECPVGGLRAIRVTGANASRDPGHSLLLN